MDNPSQPTLLKQIEIKNVMNFVKNIHFDLQQVICIHEQFYITITSQKQLYSQNSNVMNNVIQFETVPYDCKVINRTENQTNLITSCKSMPVRIYQLNSQNSQISILGSITDRKQNSQKYLSPLQISKKQNLLLGGGHKFLSSYNLDKIVAMRYGCMDKKNISAVQIFSDQQTTTGTFQGNLYMIDNKTHKVIQQISPHLDAVTQISLNQHNHNYFMSSARKDNYKYIWDKRNLSQFISCLQHQSDINQRIGVSWFNNGQSVISGNNQCQVLIWDLINQDYIKNKKIKLGNISKNLTQQSVINSVIPLSSGSQFLISSGTRRFFLNQDYSTIPKNIIGIVKI